jgi:hypothetical protein
MLRETDRELQEGYMVTRIALLVILASLAGCATGGPKEGGVVATFVHPTTGDSKVCHEQNPGLLTALCIPCAFAQVGSAFADCKSDLEQQGYARQSDTK